MKHAEAPWTAQKQASNDEMHIVSADNRFIASLEGEVYDEREPHNAHLIAAAPELLDTLTDTFDAINRGVDIGQDATELYDQIQAAINRAEGL